MRVASACASCEARLPWPGGWRQGASRVPSSSPELAGCALCGHSWASLFPVLGHFLFWGWSIVLVLGSSQGSCDLYLYRDFKPKGPPPSWCSVAVPFGLKPRTPLPSHSLSNLPSAHSAPLPISQDHPHITPLHPGPDPTDIPPGTPNGSIQRTYPPHRPLPASQNHTPHTPKPQRPKYPEGARALPHTRRPPPAPRARRPRPVAPRGAPKPQDAHDKKTDTWKFTYNS
jgi:hypothetical protein